MSRFLVSVRLAPCSETKLDAVLCAGDVVEADEHGNAVTWRESYAPGSLRLPQRGATVEFGHDAAVIGQVVTVGSAGGWIHADCVVESDDPQVMARIRPGTPVSLGGQALATDNDYGLLIRRHTLVELEHVAVCRDGERPAFPDAKIVSVRETALMSRKPNLKRVLTAEEANAEIWRRVRSGMDFADAYDHDLISRAPATGSWWLPIPQDCLSAA